MDNNYKEFEGAYIFNEQQFFIDYARFLLNKLMERYKHYENN